MFEFDEITHNQINPQKGFEEILQDSFRITMCGNYCTFFRQDQLSSRSKWFEQKGVVL